MAEKDKRNYPMKLQTVISAIALVSAMTLSGGAFAQAATEMKIGDMVIPEANIAELTEKCAALNVAATQSLATPNDESDDATATGTVVANGEDDPLGGSSDPASDEAITLLMSSLTVEQCKEAGL